MTTQLTRFFFLAISTLIIITAATNTHAQHRIPRSVMASGCVKASGSGHQIHGTVGQAAVGTAKSNSHAGFFGFWYDGDNTTVAVETLNTTAAPSFELIAVFPQPVHDQLTCIVRMPEHGSVEVAVYGLLGRLIHRCTVRMHHGGTHRLKLALPGLPTGIHMLSASWNGQTRTQRLAVLH